MSKKKLFLLVAALFYFVSVITQKPAQANPLAIAIPSAAVATYTALTAITVGSVFVFATVNTPNIPGIAWNSLRVSNPAPSAVSDLTRTVEADATLKVALNELRNSYNQVVAGIELAYADGATTVDQGPIQAFYTQVQNTCAAFSGRLNCAALATSFPKLLETSDTRRIGTSTGAIDVDIGGHFGTVTRGAVGVESADGLLSSEVFAYSNRYQYDGDCGKDPFFNQYSSGYRIFKNNHTTAYDNAAYKSDVQLYLISKQAGANNQDACFVDAKGNAYERSLDLVFYPAMGGEWKKYQKLGPQSPFKRCLLDKLGQLNSATCTEKTSRDFCAGAITARNTCANQFRLPK